LIKLDKKQVIVKKAQKSIKGGFWGNFVYTGGGRCKMCSEVDLDQ